jgi:hypothetical protein
LVDDREDVHRPRAVLGVRYEVNITVVCMGNQQATFSKRRREQELQERARAKQEKRAARRNGPRTSGGPQIAWDEAVTPGPDTPAPSVDPAGDRPADDDTPT